MKYNLKTAFKETKQHGRLDFPYTVYVGIIPKYFKSFPLHWHREFEIIYINSGYGTVFVDTKSYDCCNTQRKKRFFEAITLSVKNHAMCKSFAHSVFLFMAASSIQV